MVLKRHHWTALIILFIFTIYDIVMVNEYHFGWGQTPARSIYHLTTYMFLIPCVVFLVTLIMRSWKVAAYSFTFIFSGWLDFLFFFLQAKPWPWDWPWLWKGCTTPALATLALSSLTIVVILDLCLPDFNQPQPDGYQKKTEISPECPLRQTMST